MLLSFERSKKRLCTTIISIGSVAFCWYILGNKGVVNKNKFTTNNVLILIWFIKNQYLLTQVEHKKMITQDQRKRSCV